MSNIAAFKNGELKPQPRNNVTAIRHSLVGASQIVHGRSGATYAYPDGRVCEHPDGDKHDCLYVDARNRLIPAAMRAAFATPLVDDPNGIKRSAAFLAEMTRIAKATGVQP